MYHRLLWLQRLTNYNKLWPLPNHLCLLVWLAYTIFILCEYFPFKSCLSLYCLLTLYTLSYCLNRLEWYSPFCRFLKRVHCCRSGTFQTRKIIHFGRARQSSLCKKWNYRDLKNGYFCVNIFKDLPFSLRTNAKKKIPNSV